MTSLFLQLFTMPDFTSSSVWVSLLTLIFLEIVLGVDNIIFISIVSGRLPESERRRATNIGLLLAMFLRILLLFGISFLTAMREPFTHFEFLGISGALTGQGVILLLGGVFLLYKSVTEIHHKLEGEDAVDTSKLKEKMSMSNAITQITVINIVFSLDSILTAIGMVNGLEGAGGPDGELVLMILGVVISVLVMMLFAVPVGNFVNKHPTIQMLGLSFLILIGFMLITEGSHLNHISFGNSTVGAIPKGYLYFAIAFSLLVEMLNMRLRKRQDPVQLHGAQEQAAKENIIDEINENI